MNIKKTDIMPELDWFANKLDSNFSLDLDDKSKVIFGFNGVGKSSLCRIIKGKYPDEVDFLDYKELEDNYVANNEQTLRISYDITNINRLQNRLHEIESQLDLKKLLKINGITNSSKRKTVSKELEESCSQNKFPRLKSSAKSINDFNTKFTGIKLPLLFEYFKGLVNVSKVEEEINKNKTYSESVILEQIIANNEFDSAFCPVCETEINWRDILERKIHEQSRLKSELFESMRQNKIELSLEELNVLVRAAKYLKENLDVMFDLAITGTDVDNYEKLSNLYNERETIISQLNVLQKIAKEKYVAVVAKKENIINDMEKYFNVQKEDISFDDENFLIEIKFPRPISTYSTGEINLILFLHRIYSFLGSDKNILVLDDPISSLDIINEYKVAYEIVSNCNQKHIVIFTHVIDFVNILNSQRNGFLDFYYIEEYAGVLQIEKINYAPTKESPNVISLQQMESFDADGIIKQLRKRENDNSNSEVFHYFENECFIDNDSSKLSNHKLISLIDNFQGFQISDFYVNSITKIKYLVALRLWVEKQLYQFIRESEDKQKYLSKETLHSRIEFIFPRGKKIKFDLGSTNVSREKLMCKKVMLNQNIHYSSQTAHFYYILNLSLQDLHDEILDIKNMFL